MSKTSTGYRKSEIRAFCPICDHPLRWSAYCVRCWQVVCFEHRNREGVCSVCAPCSICGDPPNVPAYCVRCWRVVCNRHRTEGMCSACTARSAPTPRARVEPKPNWGRCYMCRSEMPLERLAPNHACWQCLGMAYRGLDGDL